MGAREKVFLNSLNTHPHEQVEVPPFSKSVTHSFTRYGQHLHLDTLSFSVAHPFSTAHFHFLLPAASNLLYLYPFHIFLSFSISIQIRMHRVHSTSRRNRPSVVTTPKFTSTPCSHLVLPYPSVCLAFQSSVFWPSGLPPLTLLYSCFVRATARPYLFSFHIIFLRTNHIT